MIDNSNWMLDHFRDLGLTNSTDFQIFQFARTNKYNAVITLDEDFNSLQLMHGVPPKIIWLRTGN
jgi:predicted nuclease of predicted toxin-antitoxin system